MFRILKIIIKIIFFCIILINYSVYINQEKKTDIFTQLPKNIIYNLTIKNLQLQTYNTNDAKYYLEYLLNGEQNTENIIHLSIIYGTIFYKEKKYKNAKKIFSVFKKNFFLKQNLNKKQKKFLNIINLKINNELERNTESLFKKIIFLFSDKEKRDIKYKKYTLKIFNKILKNWSANAVLCNYIIKKKKKVKIYVKKHYIYIAEYYKQKGNTKASKKRMEKLL